MPVTYTPHNHTRILTIDRPDRRNAVDRATAEALRARYYEFVADDDARVLVVTGAGGQAFCAGADLKAMDSPVAAPEGPMGFTRTQSPKPTIAAIEGWCVAGGLEIACWCDIRIANEGATLGCLERRWGVPLIDGGTQRLPRIVGLGRALDLILSGRTVTASEALDIGLVSRVVPDGAALDAALTLADEIAAYPWACVLADRQAAYDGLGKPLAEGLQVEAALGRTVIAEAQQGAARFASGEGRHGTAAPR
ncbi:MAG TPA: crotonase/enoyl-CoA hydratase family protein [Dehalococcoidia bacterium]|nr:crotonase/enoyl-CoA hydratase family protein [Dehalococcoidia bacterium]